MTPISVWGVLGLCWVAFADPAQREASPLGACGGFASGVWGWARARVYTLQHFPRAL